MADRSTAPVWIDIPTVEVRTDPDPELVERIYDLLKGPDPDADRLDAELQALDKQFGGTAYSELIHLLSHLRFDPASARRHWKGVLSHRDWMLGRLRAPVDLRVALVSYFLEANRRRADPKVIELKLFEETRARPCKRFDVTLDGKFRRSGEELHPLITINVSENGMLFMAGEPLSVGLLIDLKLPLPRANREIELVGRVTRVRGLGGGKFEAAIGFVHIPSGDRRILAWYVASAQTS